MRTKKSLLTLHREKILLAVAVAVAVVGGLGLNYFNRVETVLVPVVAASASPSPTPTLAPLPTGVVTGPICPFVVTSNTVLPSSIEAVPSECDCRCPPAPKCKKEQIVNNYYANCKKN